MTEKYILSMQQLTYDRLSELHMGVSELIYTDFPDYGNVGDSAIALGQLEFYKSNNITVRDITSCSTAPSKFPASVPVVINGGGNLGDSYPHHQELRLRLGRQHTSTIIQAPQSIHFKRAEGLREFIKAYKHSVNFRLGLRDLNSVSLVQGINAEITLSPDAFHCLGRIDSAEPKQKMLVLARTDTESGSLNPGLDTHDWPREVEGRAIGAKFRDRSRVLPPPIRRIANLSRGNWHRIATQRFQGGVELLSTAETIVTDRLHAMLIALQMGRSVIAIDNNNRKLRNYAETWFGNQQPDLRFANNISEAGRLLSK